MPIYSCSNKKTGGSAFPTKAQLERGSAATSYEPYHEPTTTVIDLTGKKPLRKIGDVSDYIDYDRGKIVRNIGKVDITSLTKDIKNHQTYGQYCAVDVNNLNIKKLYNYSVNHHYLMEKYKCSGRVIETFVNNTFCIDGTIDDVWELQIKDSSCSTVEEYQARLNGSHLYYVLATPTEEDITLPSISVSK